MYITGNLKINTVFKFKVTISVLIYFLFLSQGFSQVTNLGTGSWSNSALWSGGQIPTFLDSIYLNYDVTVDINANCAALNSNGHNVTIYDGLKFNILGRKAIVDIDNNIYHTVNFGTKVWTKENLNVSRYRNGDTIPQVTDQTIWNSLTTGAWCWYNNDSANGILYGKLYNWYAVNDPRGLAPLGWHVPTELEWIALGGYNIANFNALLGGYRDHGGFFVVGGDGFWWSSTGSLFAKYAQYFYKVKSDTKFTENGIALIGGLSVRCVKD